jgi:transcriptional regulator with XRE-family HTH domain
LHQELARALARKPSFLSGEEIRFLRKHAGFPAQQFAALLGVSPEHLSRVENGHTSTLGSSTDRLARAIATIATNGEEARRILLRIADQVGKVTDWQASERQASGDAGTQPLESHCVSGLSTETAREGALHLLCESVKIEYE